MRKSKAPGDRRFCLSCRVMLDSLAAPVMLVVPNSPVSVQKPCFLIFSSLQSSSGLEFLAWLNSFFIFFGTEALIAKIFVHEKSHLPGNLVS